MTENPLPFDDVDALKALVAEAEANHASAVEAMEPYQAAVTARAEELRSLRLALGKAQVPVATSTELVELVNGPESSPEAIEAIEDAGAAIHPCLNTYTRWWPTQAFEGDFYPLLAPTLSFWGASWSGNPRTDPKNVDPAELAVALNTWVAAFCPDVPSLDNALYGTRVPVRVEEQAHSDRSFTIWVPTDPREDAILSNASGDYPRDRVNVGRGELVDVVTHVVNLIKHGN